jgi:glutamate dehydrogenase/leucine dehydrogenase
MAVVGLGQASISRGVAEVLPPAVRVVAPADNVPYTSEGADVLHRRAIAALPDFVCNAGAVIGYRSALEASPETVLADVDRTIVELTSEALSHPGGPLAGACERAAAFLRGWWGEPPAPLC